MLYLLTVSVVLKATRKRYTASSCTALLQILDRFDQINRVPHSIVESNDIRYFKRLLESYLINLPNTE